MRRAERVRLRLCRNERHKDEQIRRRYEFGFGSMIDGSRKLGVHRRMARRADDGLQESIIGIVSQLSSAECVRGAKSRFRREAKALVFMHGRCFDPGSCRPWSLLAPGSTPDDDDEEDACNPSLRLCGPAWRRGVGCVLRSAGGAGCRTGSVKFTAGDADNPDGSAA